MEDGFQKRKKASMKWRGNAVKNIDWMNELESKTASQRKSERDGMKWNELKWNDMNWMKESNRMNEWMKDTKWTNEINQMNERHERNEQNQIRWNEVKRNEMTWNEGNYMND